MQVDLDVLGYIDSDITVNIIKDGILCEKKNENGNFLKLYDKVVVKGKNLYDGKIVG